MVDLVEELTKQMQAAEAVSIDPAQAEPPATKQSSATLRARGFSASTGI